MSEVRVRRIRPEEWRALRAVRLAALADAPGAFASTVDAEAALADEVWADRARTGAGSSTMATFVAEHADTPAGPVGLVGGRAVDDSTELFSMWVHPDHRGRAVADALVEAVRSWAQSSGQRDLQLWVTVDNERARRFYERCGFEALDEFTPLPSDPCKNEQRMRLAIARR